MQLTFSVVHWREAFVLSHFKHPVLAIALFFLIFPYFSLSFRLLPFMLIIVAKNLGFKKQRHSRLLNFHRHLKIHLSAWLPT